MTKRLRFLVAVCGMFWAASGDARQSQENNGPPQSSQQGPDINGPIQRPKEESAILPSAAQHEARERFHYLGHSLQCSRSTRL